ncbi:MAG: hypothetical protein QXL86_03505 [Candidatus Aenigmatarchaeota archaeon]
MVPNSNNFNKLRNILLGSLYNSKINDLKPITKEIKRTINEIGIFRCKPFKLALGELCLSGSDEIKCDGYSENSFLTSVKILYDKAKNRKKFLSAYLPFLNFKNEKNILPFKEVALRIKYKGSDSSCIVLPQIHEGQNAFVYIYNINSVETEGKRYIVHVSLHGVNWYNCGYQADRNEVMNKKISSSEIMKLLTICDKINRDYSL